MVARQRGGMSVLPPKAIPLNPPSQAKGEAKLTPFRRNGEVTPTCFQESGEVTFTPFRRKMVARQRGGMLLSPPKAIPLNPPSQAKGEAKLIPFRRKGVARQRGGMSCRLAKLFPPPATANATPLSQRERGWG
jgi:hypothetical protein